MNVQLTVNGEPETFEVTDSDTLLDALRRNGYTGTNRACDNGECGMCRVLVDGEPTESCDVAVAEIEGAAVETIEGLGTQKDLHPIQAAFIDNAAVQCGYCTPGMVMTAKAFLEENPTPTEPEAREAIDDVLCRCTGYEKIVEAVLDAADRMNAERVAADGGSAGDPGGRRPNDGGDST